MGEYILRIVINLIAFLPSGFIIGRKVGKSGWFYAMVTPFFVEWAEVLTVIFVVRISGSWVIYLTAQVTTALLAGFIGGVLGQISKRSLIS